MVDDLIGLLVSFLWRGRATGPRGRPRGRRPSRPACVRYRRTSSPSYSAQGLAHGRRRPNGDGETVATRRPHPTVLSESQDGSPRILVVLFPPLSAFPAVFFPSPSPVCIAKTVKRPTQWVHNALAGVCLLPLFVPFFFYFPTQLARAATKSGSNIPPCKPLRVTTSWRSPAVGPRRSPKLLANLSVAEPGPAAASAATPSGALGRRLWPRTSRPPPPPSAALPSASGMPRRPSTSLYRPTDPPGPRHDTVHLWNRTKTLAIRCSRCGIRERVVPSRAHRCIFCAGKSDFFPPRPPPRTLQNTRLNQGLQALTPKCSSLTLPSKTRKKSAPSRNHSPIPCDGK